MRRRALVIINPSSADFEAERRWPELESLLAKTAELTVVKTEADGQQTMQRIAQALTQDHDRVVAIGGDGTAHVVLNAMMNAGTHRLPEFAIIPFGTANDVAKSLELPLHDLKRQAEIALGDHTGKLDIARISARKGSHTVERFFVDAVTVGMDADVLAARGHYRDLKGYLAYVAALAERAVEQHSLDVHLEIDDGVVDTRVFNVIINNVPVYAGELRMPESRQDDGLLDVYLFNRREYTSKLISFAIKQVDVLKLGVSELLEDITENQRSIHGRRVRVRLASPRSVQVDGEVLGDADEIECEVVAQLRVAC